MHYKVILSWEITLFWVIKCEYCVFNMFWIEPIEKLSNFGTRIRSSFNFRPILSNFLATSVNLVGEIKNEYIPWYLLRNITTFENHCNI